MKVNVKKIIVLMMILTLSLILIQNTNVYAYSNTTNDISEITEDESWLAEYLLLLEQGTITQDEFNLAHSEFMSRDIFEEQPLIQPQYINRSFRGNVQWQPAQGEDYLPLKRVKVELYLHYGGVVPQKITETFTDDNGDYEFISDNWWQQLLTQLLGPGWTLAYQNWSVRIYPEGETFMVARDWVGVHIIDALNSLVNNIFPNPLGYHVSSSVGTWFWETNKNFGTLKIPYAENNDTNKAFHISQALVMAERFAQDVRNLDINNKVTTLYPFGTGDSAFCWGVFMGIQEASFDNWSTIVHEYGHFLQSELDTNNITLVDYIYYGPTHYTHHDHMSPKSNNGKGNKNFGAKLAWTESWASVFSLMVHDYYNVGYFVSNKSLLDVGIEKTPSLTIDTEFVLRADSGEGQEDAIIAFLWNLYKQNWFGQHGLWETTTIAGTYKFSDYIQNLYDSYPNRLVEIGSLLGKYQLAPGNLQITNVNNLSSDEPPTFTWRLNGSNFNPLNRVEIVFFDNNLNEIYSTNSIDVNLSYNSTATYTLKLTDWENVLSINGNNPMGVAVRGYNKTPTITGGYISNVSMINHVTIIGGNLGTSHLISSNTFNFSNQYNQTPISSTHTTSDGLVFDVNRLRTGIINGNYLTMSSKTLNVYEAYMEYYFDVSIVRLEYCLALWSGGETLINNSSIRLDIFSNNNWQEYRTFLAKDMSQSKDDLYKYIANFDEPINGFRFIIETSHNITTSSNNRGRMVIGDLIVYEEKDDHTHHYGAPYIPILPINHFDMRKHYSTCACGDVIVRPCMAFAPEPDETAYCYFCGQDMGSGIIQLMNIDDLLKYENDCSDCYDNCIDCYINGNNCFDCDVDVYYFERKEIVFIEKNRKNTSYFN